MGGERVKDMDHFVASVETPQITLKLPDIADTVASIMSQGCMPFQVNGWVQIKQLLRLISCYSLYLF